MYTIQKLEGLNKVDWNGTIEDLEGFNVTVFKESSDETFRGKVVNGYAVALTGLAMSHIAKALKEIR